MCDFQPRSISCDKSSVAVALNSAVGWAGGNQPTKLHNGPTSAGVIIELLKMKNIAVVEAQQASNVDS